MFDFTERKQNAGLTRISVQSSGDFFMVRHGSEEPVKVRRRGARLECECLQWECAHIASLRLCGFVDQQHDQQGGDMPMAA